MGGEDVRLAYRRSHARTGAYITGNVCATHGNIAAPEAEEPNIVSLRRNAGMRVVVPSPLPAHNGTLKL
jgi:hypothetical protein